MFAREREEVRAEHAALPGARPRRRRWSSTRWWGASASTCSGAPSSSSAGARHGGMILVVDAAARGGVRAALDGPAAQVPLRSGRAFASLPHACCSRSSSASPPPPRRPSVGWSDFALDASPDLERLEQAVFELSRLIANLTAIDGAVVLDKRFGLLGFGAEVSAELPAPARVWRALDTEGRRARARRHRERGHAPPRRLSLRPRSPARPRHRHLPRRRRVLRRQSRRRGRVLGAVGEPVRRASLRLPQSIH